MGGVVTLHDIGPGPLVLTCEHASAHIPAPLRAGAADRRWLATHWAVDIGAANLVREIARRTSSVAVLARFSRLVCDANRPPEAADWIRPEVEGRALELNSTVAPGERRRRRRLYHDPYHAEVDRVIQARLDAGLDPLLVAVHSFTPQLGRERRRMEAGVLFDQHHELLARRLAYRLRRAGLRTALNRPYSGRRGLIYSVQRHGQAHGLPYLQLELRQDRVADPSRARAMGRLVADALRQLG